MKSIRFHEKSGISRNRQRQGLKFRKLQKDARLTVINEIFKFPPRCDSLGQVIYLFELSSGYSNQPTLKWRIWTSFQSSRNGFHKLQEAIWLTVIKKFFKLPPLLGPFVK